MAVVTVCDICRREVKNNEGIEVTCSDWKKFIPGSKKYKYKRNYTAKICDSCVANIKNYCRDYQEQQV
ncbi:hypothetical protein [Clostridium sp. AF32-12BH]|uniref:hypothetical protein n=1 Tax=Clostridium sp. AF32-12BH TaxID=2292006 RepID=UPI0011C230D4|nr:hypothetical protein [Clostridium sp. AF32-12BH]